MVLMPVGAFIDSDITLSAAIRLMILVLMPVGAFIDSDEGLIREGEWIGY